MASDIRARLETAILEAEEVSRSRLRASRELASGSETAFTPIRQAAEEIREQLRSLPSIKFTINPDSVIITLMDRELWFGYDAQSGTYLAEESAHSWYDAERYAKSGEWTSADKCTDAMIRLCAEYVRMARAINA